jgi:hypothetical protein
MDSIFKLVSKINLFFAILTDHPVIIPSQSAMLLAFDLKIIFHIYTSLSFEYDLWFDTLEKKCRDISMYILQ